MGDARVLGLQSSVSRLLQSSVTVTSPADIACALLSNAITAGARRVHITLYTYRTLRVKVLDDGAGFPSAALQKLAAGVAASDGRVRSFLQALAMVSSVEIVSSSGVGGRESDGVGGKVWVRFGECVEEDVSASGGRAAGPTVVDVSEIFGNLPVRRRAVFDANGRARKETVDRVARVAAVAPDTAVYVEDGETQDVLLDLPAVAREDDAGRCESSLDRRWRTRLEQLWGKDLVSGMSFVEKRVFGMARVSGYWRVVETPVQAKSILSVNGAILSDNHEGYSHIRSFAPKRQNQSDVANKLGFLCVLNFTTETMSPATADLRALLKDLLKEQLEETSTRHPCADPSDSLDFGDTGRPRSQNAENTLLKMLRSRKRKASPNPNVDIDKIVRFRARVLGDMPPPDSRPPGVDQGHAIRSTQDFARTAVSIDRSLLTEMVAVGQVDRKFIALNHKGTIFLLDQHAADERVRFERLLKLARNVSSVKLRAPHHIPYSSSLGRLLKRPGSLTGALSTWGWAVQDDDMTRTFRVIRVPSILGVVEGDLTTLEAFCHEENKSDSEPAFVRRIAASCACKSAIKFGDFLEEPEVRKLVDSLSQCEFPFQCAHGRPSLVPIVRLDGYGSESVGVCG